MRKPVRNPRPYPLGMPPLTSEDIACSSATVAKAALLDRIAPGAIEALSEACLQWVSPVG